VGRGCLSFFIAGVIYVIVYWLTASHPPASPA
jgi:hypothetical protein